MTNSSNSTHWLDVAKKINSIAQCGLAFTNDKFDKERYEQLLDLSIDILNNITEIDSAKLQFVFHNKICYINLINDLNILSSYFRVIPHFSRMFTSNSEKPIGFKPTTSGLTGHFHV